MHKSLSHFLKFIKEYAQNYTSQVLEWSVARSSAQKLISGLWCIFITWKQEIHSGILLGLHIQDSLLLLKAEMHGSLMHNKIRVQHFLPNKSSIFANLCSGWFGVLECRLPHVLTHQHL